MDSSTKLYSIVNITVNDVADRRNKVTISSNFRHYKNRHVCVMDFYVDINLACWFCSARSHKILHLWMLPLQLV